MIYEWTVTLEHGACVCFEYTKLGFDPQHFVSPQLNKELGWWREEYDSQLRVDNSPEDNEYLCHRVLTQQSLTSTVHWFKWNPKIHFAIYCAFAASHLIIWNLCLYLTYASPKKVTACTEIAASQVLRGARYAALRAKYLPCATPDPTALGGNGGRTMPKH